MRRFSKLSGKQVAFYISVFGVEFLICVSSCVLLFLARDSVLEAEPFKYVDGGAFVDSINNFNIGLIFAMFLAVFVSDSSASIEDARQHPAYRQPLVIVVVNSFLLCCLTLIDYDISEQWINISAVMCSLPLLFSNIKRMWELIKISWSSTGAMMNKNRD